MKVSLKWLNDLVKIDDLSTEELLKKISLYSIEIDAVYQLSSATNVIVGYVVSKEKHPSADKLSICMVDVGTDIRQIICGAPNVDRGQKVVVATEGASLPGGLIIKKSTIRGVESNGMICSLKELGLEKKYIPEEFQDGIVILDQDAPIGMNALTYLGFDDSIIELGLTPNRSDLLSLRGVANDVAAVLNRKVNQIDFKLTEAKKETKDYITVENLSEQCISYYAKVVEGIQIAPSPNWLKSKLIASGIRPINNVVDITNYILMLFGQPLHAFDYEKLGKSIVVRNAFNQEKTTTLDGELRTLIPSDLVITNGLEVVAIAGVMGCKNTEVSNDTTSIVLEAAVFDPKSVRKTSSRLGLRSESSMRFERGVDVNQTKLALDYACHLLTMYASGQAFHGTASVGIKQLEDKCIDLAKEELESILGITFETKDVLHIFDRLGFKSSVHKNIFRVFVPNRRLDITIKEDVIEEVARIHGYENLPITLPKQTMSGGLTLPQRRLKQIKRTLSGLGIKEVITYSLTSNKNKDLFQLNQKDGSKDVILMNPMSEERSTMRLGLIPSMLEVVSYNQARRMKDIHLFEVGSSYYQTDKTINESKMLAGVFCGEFQSLKWQGNVESIDFYVVKGILNRLFEDLGISVTYRKLAKSCSELHPNRSAELWFENEYIGFVGELHPKYERMLDLSGIYAFELYLDSILNQPEKTILFKEISRFPSVERDLSFVVKNNIDAALILKTIQNVNHNLISDISIFDLYKGDKVAADEYSIAVRITFQAGETLTDEIIQPVMKQIINAIQNKLEAKLRD